MGAFFVASLCGLTYYFFRQEGVLPTLSESVSGYGKAGESIYTDLASANVIAFEAAKADKEAGMTEAFVVTDRQSTGMQIRFARQGEAAAPEGVSEASERSIRFPKNYTEPIVIGLNKDKQITMLDQSAKYDYRQSVLTSNSALSEGVRSMLPQGHRSDADKRGDSRSDDARMYLTYTSPDERKTLYYAYQSDQALGGKQLKNWVLYREGKGDEREAYTFQNAKIKKNDDGSVSIFYVGEKDIQNQKAAAQVDQSLLERAQKVVAADMQQDLMANNTVPDITVPRPYFIDKESNRMDLEWEVDTDTSTIALHIRAKPEQYPLALDPTLVFFAPGESNSGSVVTGEGGALGVSVVAGDFNADGTTDLAVSAPLYSTNTGRAYIFYNDGSIPTTVGTADVTITGETTDNYFGTAFTAGDFNADGKTDLAIGANGYSTNTGRAYSFYNDGSIPTTAGTADVTITGGATNNYFGTAFTAGDFNA
ncbi:MAG: FG-GAP repeat protein, partial [Candidatus Moranbacteria bacterium]|nr:FG-GAP repeat protein [Candidatus Moranbacteria bacterium]